MQKIYIVFYLLFSFFLYSCTDESTSNNNEETAVLKVVVGSSQSQEVSTRTTFNEDGIHNLHVLVYNSSHNLIGSGYSSTGNSVTLTTRVGTGNTVYAIANTYNSSLFDGSVATSEPKLITLLSSTSTLEGIMVSGSTTSGLVMSGSKTGVNISSSGTTISSSDFKISRLAARINLNIKGYSGITITGYTIKNVPKKGYIVARPNTNESLITDLAVGDDASSTSSDRFDVPVTGLNTTGIYSTSFYMYENRRGGRVSGTGTSTNEREKVTYAPTGATYIEIYAKGTTFNSVYKVYLGADNCQNYNVKRNVNYTYDINLRGAMSYDTRVTTNILVTPTAVAESNCYMVTPGSVIRIPVSRANTAVPGVIPDVTKNWDADLLWTDNSAGLAANGVIENIVADYPNGGILVKAGSSEGNAVVVVKNLSGTTLWSWHIWVTSYNPDASGSYYVHNSYTWMNRNLGATSATPGAAGSAGLLYQWGRKDPFPGLFDLNQATEKPIYDTYGAIKTINFVPVPNVTNNLLSSIANPSTIYYNYSTSPYDWYTYSGPQNNTLWGTSKTIYDPCPVGWHLPAYNTATSTSPWSEIISSTRTWTAGAVITSPVSAYYPAAGYRWAGGGISNDGNGHYWCAVASLTDVNAYTLSVTSGYLRLDYGSRTSSYSVRCVK